MIMSTVSSFLSFQFVHLLVFALTWTFSPILNRSSEIGHHKSIHSFNIKYDATCSVLIRIIYQFEEVAFLFRVYLEY